jgi:hypothetical protein
MSGRVVSSYVKNQSISNKALSRSNSACNSASVGMTAWYLLANSWALSASSEYLATAALLVFHNHAANVPIDLHHGGVDSLAHLDAGSQQQGADGLVQLSVIYRRILCRVCRFGDFSNHLNTFP